MKMSEDNIRSFFEYFKRVVLHSFKLRKVLRIIFRYLVVVFVVVAAASFIIIITFIAGRN